MAARAISASCSAVGSMLTAQSVKKKAVPLHHDEVHRADDGAPLLDLEHLEGGADRVRVVSVETSEHCVGLPFPDHETGIHVGIGGLRPRLLQATCPCADEAPRGLRRNGCAPRSH